MISTHRDNAMAHPTNALYPLYLRPQCVNVHGSSVLREGYSVRRAITQFFKNIVLVSAIVFKKYNNTHLEYNITKLPRLILCLALHTMSKYDCIGLSSEGRLILTCLGNGINFHP